MELYQNQVTRGQGPFSLRMFHRSRGIMLIHANIGSAEYDIIGITSILPNVGKVKKMCQLIRAHQPQATIAVGGHIANCPDLDRRVDADYIVRGEGVSWFRQFHPAHQR